MKQDLQLSEFPGGDIVLKGLRDLSAHLTTEESVMLRVAGPRLRQLGFDIPDEPVPPYHEHQLYTLIEERVGRGAHAAYNALRERVLSFIECYERELRLRGAPPEAGGG